MIELFLIAQLSLFADISQIAVITAHGADLATTSWAIGNDPIKFKESNPLLRWASNKPIKLALAKSGFAIAVNYPLARILKKNHPKWFITINIVQTIFIGYVAYRNQDLVKKMNLKDFFAPVLEKVFNNPTSVAVTIQAFFAMAIGLEWVVLSQEQLGLVMGFITTFLGLWVRNSVTPNTKIEKVVQREVLHREAITGTGSGTLPNGNR